MAMILLTNDDGYGAPGLEALYQECLLRQWQPVIIAPAGDCSGCGHGATFHTPVRIEEVEKGFIVYGTPVDCVYLALYHLKLPLSAVFSGINAGPNLGDDLWYSGTAAAAREAALNQIPALAVSQVHPDQAQLASIATTICDLYQKSPPVAGQWHNYNFPEKFDKEVSLAFLGRRHRGDTTESYVDKRGKKWVWLGAPKSGIIESESDFDIISRNIISLTISGS